MREEKNVSLKRENHVIVHNISAWYTKIEKIIIHLFLSLSQSAVLKLLP